MLNNNPSPRQYKGVMVSITFADLKEHRTALIKAIDGQELKSVVMENDSAKPGIDVLDSSLLMVRDSSAYVGVISHKYGQVPECSIRNPDGLSLTELEFKEARSLGRPILLFIMGDEHDVKPGHVEKDPEKSKKLDAFRENSKCLNPDSSVHRVYKVFNGLPEFKVAAMQAIAELRRFLDEHSKPVTEQYKAVPDLPQPRIDPIPTPPAFYAEPPYLGSHKFLGRKAQLNTLADWASHANPHPVLLFEAIGGTGKSMLSWDWTTSHATQVRSDWAGRFWYSFYEKGAIMADFCRRALAYITMRPLKDFRKKKTPELGELLLHHLQAHPWLLILDGIERVLVAYHRYDAAQLADEEAGTSDQIAHRDPCAAIRPEDDDLLRSLAAATPSKLLITSRLVPRVLLNAARQPIPGVLRERLPGLRPADAEALLRACGVSGNGPAIQNYLQRHCDCHPLIIGVLAGLIHDYMPNRGNFNDWATDQLGGGKLNLAELNLVQKRNHILNAAINALPEKSRQFLSTLALLSEAVDYATISALNPHLPPEPEKVNEPSNPEGGRRWKKMSDNEKEQALQDYQTALQRHGDYVQALKFRLQSQEFLSSQQKMVATVTDLERRGLLQYDTQAKRYDLHPVVRGIASGGLQQEEKEFYGQRVVDYFSRQAHSPYDEVESLEDLRCSLHVVHTLLQMGHLQEAYNVYTDGLSNALEYNLEAHYEILSLLRPFFPNGWTTLPYNLNEEDNLAIMGLPASSLYLTDDRQKALEIWGGLLSAFLQRAAWAEVRGCLSNIAVALYGENYLAKSERCLLFALNIASIMDVKSDIFRVYYQRFELLTALGKWEDVEAVWKILDPMGRDWRRSIYRSGDAEHAYAMFRFQKGDLQEEHLIQAEKLAKDGKSRATIRALHSLRGLWRMELGQWAQAADSLHEAVRMAREVGRNDAEAEAWLSIAQFHLGHLSTPRIVAEQIAKANRVPHRALAELWYALGDHEQATCHALKAFHWAWADGEPYVHRYELKKDSALFRKLGEARPQLTPYDQSKDEKFSWEDEVVACIEQLQVEKANRSST